MIKKNFFNFTLFDRAVINRHGSTCALGTKLGSGHGWPNVNIKTAKKEK